MSPRFKAPALLKDTACFDLPWQCNFRKYMYLVYPGFWRIWVVKYLCWYFRNSLEILGVSVLAYVIYKYSVNDYVLINVNTAILGASTCQRTFDITTTSQMRDLNDPINTYISYISWKHVEKESTDITEIRI